MTPKIEVRGVGKIYQTRQGYVEALKNVNLTVQEGEFVSLIGPSGCGKSTLLRILADLYEATFGEVIIRATSGSQNPVNAVVFQEYAIFPWRTVLENVTFGLEMRGIPKVERYDTAHNYLNKVGLSRFANHYPHQLSGGMKQRVGIARAFANNPEILLMDEPFGALDAQMRTTMQEELIRIWEEERKTVLYVTHSIEEAVILSDRVLVMTALPGSIKTSYPIELPRPRELAVRTTPAYNNIAQTIWIDLVEEVNKAQELEKSVGSTGN